MANASKIIGGIVAVIVAVVAIAAMVWYYSQSVSSTQQVSYTWDQIVGQNALAKILTYTISQQPFQLGATNAVSAGIIIIALWLLILVTFANIISDFSTFSKTTSWIVAFCLAVIAANSGLIAGLAAAVTGVFVIFGVASVYVGLAAAFIVFIALNWGLKDLGSWMKERRAL